MDGQLFLRQLSQGNPLGMTYGTEYNSTVNIGFWGDHFKNSEWELQTDSLSALSELPKAAFAEQMVYRMEWFGGEDGWLRFELNDKLQYQVNASTVQKLIDVSRDGDPIGTLMSRMIPEEPSYLILNIDLSPRWGWPWCPEDLCNCCADCGNPECFTCNVRSWMLAVCEDMPASYEIDWVRVYQLPGEEQASCSPADFPTNGWISTHWDRYIAINTDEPLRPVLAGGHPCSNDIECGHGTCVEGLCQCEVAWTGPRCMVSKVGAAVSTTATTEPVTL